MTKELINKLETHFQQRQCDYCEEVMSNVYIEILKETRDAAIIRIECRTPGCKFRGQAIVGITHKEQS